MAAMTKLMLSLLLLAMLVNKLTGNPARIRPPPTSAPAKPPPSERANLNFPSNSKLKLASSFLTRPKSTSKRDRPPKPRNSGDGVFPDFLPFDCDGILNDQPADKRPTAEDLLGEVVMLMNEPYLYFFYEKFVIKMRAPVFEKLFTNDLIERTDKDVQLITTRPYYSFHTPKNEKAKDYLTAAEKFHNASISYLGSIQKSFGEKGAKTEWGTFLIIEEQEPPYTPGSEWFAHVYYVDLRKGDFGKLTHQETKKSSLMSNPGEMESGRIDFTKFFEIVYSENRRSLKFYFDSDMLEPEQTNVFERIQTYETKYVVYWERWPEAITNDTDHTFDPWLGALVELDSIHVLHFSTYLFQVLPDKLRDPQLPRIFAHHQYDLHLLDFLDCRRKEPYPFRRTNQLKGAIFYKSPGGREYTLVFIDQFYYVVNVDLMKINFHLHAPGLPKQMLKVKIPDQLPETKASEVLFDLVSTKYVKHVTVDETHTQAKFFTFDTTATFSAQFGDDFDPTKPLSLSKSDRLVHKCPHSVFSFEKSHFCIGRRDYYLISQGDFRTEYKRGQAYKQHMRQIQEIFAFNIFYPEDSNVVYGQDDIEYVFDWDHETVVWVTYHWLLIFKREGFRTEYGPDSSPFGPVKMNFAPKLRFHESPGRYRRIENCLWTRCEPIHADENGEIEDPRRHRGRSISGNHSRTSG